ncbi:MAG: polyprenyl synthetase family protein [Victivallaceae bacterium]|nr:polyprenyl synthetase family protein [Victivallaceae bacterium]
MNMQDELQKIAGEIRDFIAADTFPATISPEYLKDAVTDYPLRGGKRLRPALVLWSCGLLGGDIAKAFPAAAAVEIYHNWTLVHDDIIDDDDYRRGQPTTHCNLGKYAAAVLPGAGREFGRNFAILAGDIQQGWAANTLLKSEEYGVSPAVVLAMSRRLHEQLNCELISGEALDVEFAARDIASVSVAEVEKMLYLKTGALLRFCVEAGASIALNDSSYSDPRLLKLAEFAAQAGVAFQLRDDWLGIFGDAEKLGKPIGADLTERKPTVMLLKAFELLSPSGADELRNLLGSSITPEIIRRARYLLSESGAADYASGRAAELSAQARENLESFPDNCYRKLLSDLLEYLTARSV